MAESKDFKKFLPEKAEMEINSSLVFMRNIDSRIEYMQSQFILDETKVMDARVRFELAKVAKLVIDQIAMLDSSSATYADEVGKVLIEFESLSPEEKDFVTNADKLERAWNEVAEIATREVGDLFLTLNCKSPTYVEDVTAALSAYNALTETQRTLVKNHDKFSRAWEDVAEPETLSVTNKITMWTLFPPKNKDERLEVMIAYNALTPTQRALVKNAEHLKGIRKFKA